MTREEVMTLQPGREIDALIAENVMGYSNPKIVYAWSDRKKKSSPIKVLTKSIERFDLGDYGTFVDEEDNKIQCGKPHNIYHPKAYSAAISAAWEVVEKFDYCYLFKADMDIGNCKKGQWECKLYRDSQEVYVVADTAPHAICLAALLATLETR